MTKVRGLRFEVRGNSVRSVFALCALAAAGLLIGCRQDMQDQPKFIPQRGTDFYADGRSVRPQVENTVARGQLHADAYFYTGLVDGKEGNAMPFPVTMQVLAPAFITAKLMCRRKFRFNHKFIHES